MIVYIHMSTSRVTITRSELKKKEKKINMQMLLDQPLLLQHIGDTIEVDINSLKY